MQSRLLKQVDGFQVVSDPLFYSNCHGGLAAYVKDNLFPHLTNIRFSKCTLSFSIATIPNCYFMLVYMYPLDSINYNLGDFGILIEEMTFWDRLGYLPFIGGDFNSRIGDINILSQKKLKWRFETNLDETINSHGQRLANIFEIMNVLPLNHCKYYNKIWKGNFTYQKGKKRSQIDFVLTNSQGRRLVADFRIDISSWHLSDHLPLCLKLNLPQVLNADMLLVRALELSSSYQPLVKMCSYRFKFHTAQAQGMLTERYQMLLDSLDTHCPDLILNTIVDNLKMVLNATRIKEEPVLHSNIYKDLYQECDQLFAIYVESTQTNASQPIIEQKCNEYQKARRQLNAKLYEYHEEKYRRIIESSDSRKLWSEINWSGFHKPKSKAKVPIELMADHFETLYLPVDLNVKKDLDSVSTDTYIPLTDDPLTSIELDNACKEMKKGGYDFSLNALHMLLRVCSPIMLIFFNLVFYVSYPIEFSLSLISAIPKKGNLKLSTNYRGIHMQGLLSLLYDRIIGNRLIAWASIHPEQSAFQKGKATTNQIFLLRVIIALAKRNKIPMFIGFFDLEKAFDKVSRSLLLKSLIRLGIGSCMLNAIKAMYSVTKCLLKVGNKLSDVFLSHSGIKQGAPSSVILFIIFMDEFIDFVRERCMQEPIINSLHLLLHADDTAVLSTDKQLFIQKCNVLLQGFREKKVSLNIKKSGFLVVNPSNGNDRDNIELDNGTLKYYSSFVYLGVIFSDRGDVSTDLDLHVKDREKSVYVKLANFIRNNPLTPISIKRKILMSCLEASLLYGCEAWGSASLRKVETLHRKAIKIVFGLANNTPNEVLYIETGLSELKAQIFKRQYRFWERIKENMDQDPTTEIASVLKTAIEKNLFYTRHYENLHKFTTDRACYDHFKTAFDRKMKDDISLKANKDTACSIIVDYLGINPQLISPNLYYDGKLAEIDRKVITKYRCGNHHLRVNTGRHHRIPAHQRLCKCGQVQTLHHVLFACILTQEIRKGVFPETLEQLFQDNVFAAMKLRHMEDILKIRKFEF